MHTTQTGFADRLILCRGEVVARTYEHSGNDIAGKWGWFGQGPLGGVNNCEDTFEEVLAAIKNRHC